jgi:hypothetical protein
MLGFALALFPFTEIFPDGNATVFTEICLVPWCRNDKNTNVQNEPRLNMWKNKTIFERATTTAQSFFFLNFAHQQKAK